jgi:hypothetical protein
MDDKVARGVAALVEADREVSRLEEALKQAKATKRELETQTLISLFDDADVSEIMLPSGAKAKRTTLIEGSLPKPSDKRTPEENEALSRQRAEAFAWLIENDCGPLIKCDVVAHFDKGEFEKAKELHDRLRRESNSLDVALVEDIHPMSLQAEVRRRLTAGKEVPTELLGITALPAVRLTKKPKE